MLIAINDIAVEVSPESALSLFKREANLKHTDNQSSTTSSIKILGNSLNVTAIEKSGENHYRIRVITPAKVRIGNIDVQLLGAGARIDHKNAEIQQFAAEGLVLTTNFQTITFKNSENPEFYVRGHKFPDGNFLIQTEHGIADGKTPDKIYIHDGKIRTIRIPIPKSNYARWEVLSTNGTPISSRKMPLDASIRFDANGKVRYADNFFNRLSESKEKRRFSKIIDGELQKRLPEANTRLSDSPQ